MLYTFIYKREGSTVRRVSSGFTIVELLIVIVVIAILAAITIVSFNGVTKNARQSVLLSDVKASAMAMSVDFTSNGSYAFIPGEVNGGKGLPASDGTIYSFHSTGTSYCITANSSHQGVLSYYVSDTVAGPTLGQCPQDLGAAVTTLAGNGTLGAAAGSGTAATLAGPAGITADANGNLYFTDQQGSRVRKVTTGGVVTNIVGNGATGTTEGVGTAALFNWPQAVTVGPTGQLFVADTMNSRIRTVTLATSTASLFAGSNPGNGGAIGASGSALQFNTPRGIVYESSANAVYLADSQNNLLKKLSTGGQLLATYGNSTGAFADGNATTARFNFPQGLAKDGLGNIYIADTKNHAIRKMTPSGNVTTIAGTGGTPGFTNGTGTAALFRDPMALAVANDGTIYVADTGNHAIRKITSSGTVTTIAGNGSAGFADDSGEAARFNEPKGIAIGSDGRLYVADRANNRIRVMPI